MVKVAANNSTMRQFDNAESGIRNSEFLMSIPIVMAGFGSRGPARATYEHLGARIRAAFPEHALQWGITSRMVRHLDEGAPPGPETLLADLAARGHRWAVLQSSHLLCGHEFHRLLAIAASAPLRVSIGLPLLTDPEDFDHVSGMLSAMVEEHPEAATVFVGHGTDHPTWMAYPVLQSLLDGRVPGRAFVGVLEGRPDIDEIVARVGDTGHRQVRLVPLLMVAGTHFRRDLTGERPDSWQRRLEAAGLEVEPVAQGVGLREEVADLLCRHIAAALDVIPESGV